MKDSHFKFDQTFYPFQSEAELTTWGRMGWISENRCLIETNLDLKPGESIPVECSLFDDLGLKNVKFVCIEKNQVGRYYQYAHSLLGKIETKNTEVDLKKVKGWINDNAMISKNKPVKLVFFEADPQQRDKIAKMIKLDKRYCARGYKDITNFEETLHYQYPNLILINRNLIQKNKAEFEAIRRFVKENFCFCITYALDESLPIEEFKKNYEFAMHVINPIDEKLLESMILKLEQKIPSEEKSLFPKVFFNKYSAYSRMSFYSKILITDISTDGLQIRSPFSLNSFCSIEILSPLLYTSKLGRMQLFRAIEEKKNSKTIDGILHKLIFIGHTQKEKNTVKDIIQKIQEKKEAN